jgi:Fe-S cluster assembly protein SufB
VGKGAHHSKSNVVCDALLLDEASRSDTYPYIEIEEEQVSVGHEASVSKIGEEQLFYLMSRGLARMRRQPRLWAALSSPWSKSCRWSMRWK